MPYNSAKEELVQVGVFRLRRGQLIAGEPDRVVNIVLAVLVVLTVLVVLVVFIILAFPVVLAILIVLVLITVALVAGIVYRPLG
ncbi:hypothetical protein F5X68DRAFT_226184 [Plectosphaerella plurivora]|uniref:Uncharacterized protein n=1 Tax=Plectosphaerella plurivora TaxID=936078 RepID=A0A9P8VL03_9PEZI|nr:hypothetical protein F5X68DRAFT_226184 [Plectosphaerella plurivora]